MVLLGLPAMLGFFCATTASGRIGTWLYWLCDAWRRGGWREVWATYWPISLALALSVLVFGRWFEQGSEAIHYAHNASLFPYLVPLGVALLGYAIWRGDREAALASGPCFAPYILFHSYVPLVLANAKHPRRMALLVVLVWALGIWEALGGHL
jgi:hypothetical protein